MICTQILVQGWWLVGVELEETIPVSYNSNIESTNGLFGTMFRKSQAASSGRPRPIRVNRLWIRSSSDALNRPLCHVLEDEVKLC